ncbi:MAG: hypothetical protein JWO60_1246, partial [Frankiales bacterium]|nr:hypothetical protein [Frankiales bacterium]
GKVPGAGTGQRPGTRVPGGPGAAPTAAADGRVSAPVSLGFIVPPGDGNQANDSAGVETGQTVDLGTVYRGLIAAMNKQGGLAGRRIAPVFHESSAAAADYNAEYASACATFVEDNKTAAVLTAIGYDGAFTSCLRKGGAFLVDGAAGGADEARMRKETSFLSTGAPTLERRERAVVATGQELASFSRGTVVGALVDSCPETRVGYEKGLVPAAKKAGLSLVAVEIQCASGFSDLGAISAQLQNAVLRFRSAGVTQVTFVSNTESTGVLLFAQSAESQGYRPGYVLSSRAQPVALEQNLPEGQLRGMVGAGWSSPLDVAFDKQPARTKVQARCLALLTTVGIVPKSGADLYFSYTACDTVFAYEALLQQSGGRSGLADVAAAGGRLGRGLQLPGTYATALSPGRLDAPAVRRSFGYDRGCGCFVHRGGEKPLG